MYKTNINQFWYKLIIGTLGEIIMRILIKVLYTHDVLYSGIVRIYVFYVDVDTYHIRILLDVHAVIISNTLKVEQCKPKPFSSVFIAVFLCLF